MDARRRVLDDIAKVATSAAGLLQGAGREAETLLRQRLEALLDRMDLVPRDEFEAVKAMAAKARAENDALEARIARLESAIQLDKMTVSRRGRAKTASTAGATTTKKSSPKKPTATRKSQKSAKK